MAFAHLDGVPSSLKNGSVVTPDTVLGKLKQFTRNSCYQVSQPSGVHAHVEAANRRETSCYVKRSAGASVNSGRRIGILGGAFSKECPTNY